MRRELLIAAGPGEWRAAWLEDGAAAELYVERGDTAPAGSIHLGRVVRLVAGLDAALVEIGDERPGLPAATRARRTAGGSSRGRADRRAGPPRGAARQGALLSVRIENVEANGSPPEPRR